MSINELVKKTNVIGAIKSIIRNKGGEGKAEINELTKTLVERKQKNLEAKE